MGAPRIRQLTVADAPACVALAVTNQWQTDEAGWRSLFAVGLPLGLEDDEGGIAGTVILNRYDGGLATIAMMLVHPSLQGRGLGRALLEDALAHAGDDAVCLYATAVGRRLYERVGFVAVAEAARLTLPAPAAPAGVHPPTPRLPGVRPMRNADLDAVVALDAVAQGASRRVLLASLAGEAERAVVVERAGAVVAFGIARILVGSRVLGPIVAEDDEATLAVATALADGAREVVRVDLQPGERALERFMLGAGGAVVDTTPLMVRGGAALPGRRTLVRALASRAYG